MTTGVAELSTAVAYKESKSKQVPSCASSTIYPVESKYTPGKKRFALNNAGLHRIERFIMPPDAEGCCNWVGPSVDSQGRPHLLLTDKSKQPTRVVRMLWEHYYGELPSSTWVVNTCRNKLCCNLKHYTSRDMSRSAHRAKSGKKVFESAQHVDEPDEDKKVSLALASTSDGLSAEEEAVVAELRDMDLTLHWEDQTPLESAVLWEKLVSSAIDEVCATPAYQKMAPATKITIAFYPVLEGIINTAISIREEDQSITHQEAIAYSMSIYKPGRLGAECIETAARCLYKVMDYEEDMPRSAQASLRIISQSLMKGFFNFNGLPNEPFCEAHPCKPYTSEVAASVLEAARSVFVDKKEDLIYALPVSRSIVDGYFDLIDELMDPENSFSFSP